MEKRSSGHYLWAGLVGGLLASTYADVTSSVHLIDVNGDGMNDVVIEKRAGRPSVYLNYNGEYRSMRKVLDDMENSNETRLDELKDSIDARLEQLGDSQ